MHGKTLDAAIFLCDQALNEIRLQRRAKEILIITGRGQNSQGKSVLFYGIREHILECHRDFSYRTAPPRLGGDGAIIVERVCF